MIYVKSKKEATRLRKLSYVLTFVFAVTGTLLLVVNSIYGIALLSLAVMSQTNTRYWDIVYRFMEGCGCE